MSKPNEERYERYIEKKLTEHGYQSISHCKYDKNQCQVQEELINFIKSTQKETYDKLNNRHDQLATATLYSLIFLVI